MVGCYPKNSKRSECRESVSAECSIRKGHLYHASSPQTSENITEERKEVREKQGELSSSGFDGTTGDMSSQWLPTKHLHELKLVDIPAWSREEFMPIKEE